jgi:hypothetical protein
MVTIHQNGNCTIRRNAHQDIVDVIYNDYRIITITAVNKVCRKYGLVIAFVLIAIHVIYLKSITRERKKEHVARPGTANEPLQFLQNIDPRRLLRSINLHGLLLPRVNIMENTDIVRLEAAVLLQQIGYQEGIINCTGEAEGLAGVVATYAQRLLHH